MKEKFIPLKDYKRYPVEEMKERSYDFWNEISKRRTVREFSGEPVPKEVIINAIKAAGSAPSGANMQPWFFCAVSDQNVKSRIRQEAEKEELRFYKEKASDEWLNDLSVLGTSYAKPFLEKAPYLIVIFEKKYDILEDGTRKKLYYTKESVGLATGTLINALHLSGLAALTYTPSPMKFLNKILDRPSNEKPFMILVTGYPADNVKVPDIKRKTLEKIAKFI